MGESTLSIGYNELTQRISRFLGFDETYANLSATEQARVDDARNDGLQRFYADFDWRFLCPRSVINFWATVTGTTSGVPSYDAGTNTSTITATAAGFFNSMRSHDFTFDTSSNDYEINGYTSSTVVTVVGDASGEASGDTFTITQDEAGRYHLPDDFGGLRDSFNFASDSGYAGLKHVSQDEIDARLSISNSTGIPDSFSLEPLAIATDYSAGQRWRVLISPPSDVTYPMTYRYYKQLDALTGSGNLTYPYGGMWGRRALIEACLAEADAMMDDSQGLHEGRYREALGVAIHHDNANAPDNLGYNGDWATSRPVVDPRDTIYMTYNGNLPAGT